MAIDITERTVGMWCVNLDDAGNWLQHVARTDTPGVYELVHRFRYYVDNDMGTKSKDKRNWYRGTVRAANDAEVLRQLHNIFVFLRDATQKRQGWELLRGQMTVEQFLDAMQRQPAMHITKEQLH